MIPLGKYSLSALVILLLVVYLQFHRKCECSDALANISYVEHEILMLSPDDETSPEDEGDTMIDGNQRDEVNQRDLQHSGISMPIGAANNQDKLANQTAKHYKNLHRCTRSSMIQARQMLAHELDIINHHTLGWFNDLEQGELAESQRRALTGMIMSRGQQLLGADMQPMFELEASYFRPTLSDLQGTGNQTLSNAQQHHQQLAEAMPIKLRLQRSHLDRCILSKNRNQFIYVLGLVVGPVEHHLDLVYRLPKELVLTQPSEWRFAQVRIQTARMVYELVLRQRADYKLGDPECPLEPVDLSFVAGASSKPIISTKIGNGLPKSAQTLGQLERLFIDYTRPAVSSRLRQLLKFHLAAKTLPLQV